jgi:p-aminobenzoyl-glutamate transporter AbgT
VALTYICLIGIAVTTAVTSLVGYACAARRATGTYLGSMAILCSLAVAAFTLLGYLGRGPTHHESVGADFIAALLIVLSLALLPAAVVYSCVSGVVATRRIVPLALASSIVALPVWLCTTFLVLHYVVGGM